MNEYEQHQIDNLIEMRDFLKEKQIFFQGRKNVTTIVDKLTNLIGFIDNHIRADCKHEYVEDYIDIDPEKSMRICYCKLCYCSFPTS
jgi:hypothetical protein